MGMLAWRLFRVIPKTPTKHPKYNHYFLNKFIYLKFIINNYFL